MKATKLQIRHIANLLEVCLEHHGIHPSELNGDGNLWECWHWIHNEKTLSDDHPRFSNRQRILVPDDSFKLYFEGFNDATMTTALRAAHKLINS